MLCTLLLHFLPTPSVSQLNTDAMYTRCLPSIYKALNKLNEQTKVHNNISSLMNFYSLFLCFGLNVLYIDVHSHQKLPLSWYF